MTKIMKTTHALQHGWTLRALAGPDPRKLRAASWLPRYPAVPPAICLPPGSCPTPISTATRSRCPGSGDTTWRYRPTSRLAPRRRERVDLAFDGLDTVASIEFNGAAMGRTANMHRSYRFDVASHLREGVNELVVTFTAPVPAAEGSRRAR